MKQDFKYYPCWNVNAAMRDLYDLGERIMLPPVLLGEVARQIKAESDILFDLKLVEGRDVIEWGIPLSNITREVKSLFNTWKFKENDNGYEYTFEGIPVQIRVISKKYKFFANLDMKFYKMDEYKLPNPFKEYWKVRHLVQ